MDTVTNYSNTYYIPLANNWRIRWMARKDRRKTNGRRRSTTAMRVILELNSLGVQKTAFMFPDISSFPDILNILFRMSNKKFPRGITAVVSIAWKDNRHDMERPSGRSLSNTRPFPSAPGFHAPQAPSYIWHYYCETWRVLYFHTTCS